MPQPVHGPSGRLVSLVLWLLANLVATVHAYEVQFRDTDYSRQVCSGIWAGDSTYINVTFDASSQGQVSMVIYEWGDSQYLGKVTDPDNDLQPKTYVCTTSAVTLGYCDAAQLGHFILDLPEGKSINQTSFWSARVQLPSSPSSRVIRTGRAELSIPDDLWNSLLGNPTPPPPSVYDSPQKRDTGISPTLSNSVVRQNDGTRDILLYDSKAMIHYVVRKTGYYCVAIVPITAQTSTRRAATDVPFHPSYQGLVSFKSTFDGRLPASEYPKVNFYFCIFVVYAAFALVWAWLCYKHMHELLPLQYYLSALITLLVIEMVASWGYYRYLNAHGKTVASTIFLVVVAILDAARNSMSLFMLLVVSLGLSVVRESLGRTMVKCQSLAAAHFLFGILYAIGIVELQLESTSALVLMLFIVPLAFTLSGFLLWIMYSLNATIAQLRSRKQRYKLKMFQRLHLILLFAAIVISAFFVVSSMSFSGRFAEDYAAKSWKVQWWLLDGWMALLYLVVFFAIGYLWRPSANNRRLAMSDEIAQDEEDAEDYDLQAIENRTRLRDDDSTLVGERRGGPDPMASDHVVFEIGDEDEDEDEAAKKRHTDRTAAVDAGERQGLMHDRQSEARDD